MSGRLELHWHEAHEVEGVESADIDGLELQDQHEGEEQKPVLLGLVDEASDGYFCLSVCSTECVRSFFNQIVDDFQLRTGAK